MALKYNATIPKDIGKEIWEGRVKEEVEVNSSTPNFLKYEDKR